MIKILLLTSFSLFALLSTLAFAGTDFERVNCRNDEHHLYIEKLDHEKLRLSIFNMEKQPLFVKTIKQAEVYADNQIVKYTEDHSDLVATYKLYVGESVGTKKYKTVNLRIRTNSQGQIIAKYKDSDYILCR